jgi:hypothetical protein
VTQQSGHPGIRFFLFLPAKHPANQLSRRISNPSKKRRSLARFGRYLDFIAAKSRLPTGVFAERRGHIMQIAGRFPRNLVVRTRRLLD